MELQLELQKWLRIKLEGQGKIVCCQDNAEKGKSRFLAVDYSYPAISGTCVSSFKPIGVNINTLLLNIYVLKSTFV